MTKNCTLPKHLLVILVTTLFTSTANTAVAKTVSGRVLSPDNLPVPGVEVVVMPSIGTETTPITSDEAGKFTIEIDPHPSSRGLIGTAVAVSPDLAMGSAVWRETATEKDAYDIRLQPKAMVSGLAQDNDGKPVAGATVRLLSLTWVDPESRNGRPGLRVPERFEGKFTSVTDPDGRFTLPAVATQGGAMLVVNDERFMRTHMQVELGPNAKPAFIQALTTAVFEGTARFEDGRPAPNMAIAVHDVTQGGFWSKATSGKDGTFRLTGICGGFFNVICTDPTGQHVALAIENVEATTGKTVRLPDMLLSSGAFVEGIVIDAATGAAVPGVLIGAFGPHYPRTIGLLNTTTDPKGRYRMRVAPGKNSFVVQRAPLPYPLARTPRDSKTVTAAIGTGPTMGVDFKLLKDVPTADE